ncbi:MAG: ferrous iron transporter B, partial [Rhizobiales bacterium]|nr:ferrous iron transporter B [Hyphomicrobiales bacterium]
MTVFDLHTLRFALVGTPNSGKTSLFNALTGAKQKVANYPGVTVERKAGVFVTPGGHRISIVDLPGTYSLRGRSPDEVITRDVVLGRHEQEKQPELILCVGDATNLRLTVRLLLELKRTGCPIVLVLNMFDIAERRGVVIDVDKLSERLSVPVITAAAVRRHGTDALIEKLDQFAKAMPRAATASTWTPPQAPDLRAAQREADRVLRECVVEASKPDSLTTRMDSVALHPLWGLLLLFGILFVMFQAVFSWAKPAMDALTALFDIAGQYAAATLPEGMVLSFIKDGVLSGVGSVIVFLPQILIMFLFILLLEDFGYMARAAFLMDKIMGGAG